jgi:hypothetical protein
MKHLLETFLTIQNQLLILHWQTKSYARHKAYQNTYEDLHVLIDSFIEAYQGKYGNVKINESISIKNINNKDLNNFVQNSIDKIKKIQKSLNPSDTDLINLLDEFLIKLNKLKYLLKLK